MAIPTRRRMLAGALGAGALLAGWRPSPARAAPFSGKISVAAYPYPVHSAPYFLGLSEGLWAKNDWDIITVVSAGSGGAAVRTIATGGIPVGEASSIAAFAAWLVGAPIR